MSLRSALLRPFLAPLAWLAGWIGANPLRVAGALATLGASGVLYRAASESPATGGSGLASLADAVATHPAYALLAVVGLGAFALLE